VEIGHSEARDRLHCNMIPSVNLYGLDRRFSCVLDRIVALERAVELLARLDLISLRLTSLEAGQASAIYGFTLPAVSC